MSASPMFDSRQAMQFELALPPDAAAHIQLTAFAEPLGMPADTVAWQITPTSIWHACAAGYTAAEILTVLAGLSCTSAGAHLADAVQNWAARYGRVRLTTATGSLLLTADTPALAGYIGADLRLSQLLGHRVSPLSFYIEGTCRGMISQALVRCGSPALDLTAAAPGAPLSLALLSQGRGPQLRDYQLRAVNAFVAGGSVRGGAGIIALPPLAGKKLIGLACMAALQTSTLIVTSSAAAAQDWVGAITGLTNLAPDQVCAAADEAPRPVTVATYDLPGESLSSLTDDSIYTARDWGLVIYDDAHLMPPAHFPRSAERQQPRRLGLTPTLHRQDGRQSELMGYVGPSLLRLSLAELIAAGWSPDAGTPVACSQASAREPVPAS